MHQLFAYVKGKKIFVCGLFVIWFCIVGPKVWWGSTLIKAVSGICIYLFILLGGSGPEGWHGCGPISARGWTCWSPLGLQFLCIQFTCTQNRAEDHVSHVSGKVGAQMLALWQWYHIVPHQEWADKVTLLHVWHGNVWLGSGLQSIPDKESVPVGQSNVTLATAHKD